MKALIFLVLCFFQSLAQAQWRVEVAGVGAKQIPIVIANFPGETQTSQNLSEIVRANLTRTGLFRLMDAGTTALDETTPLNVNGWRSRSVDAVLAGSVTRLADGRFDVRTRLSDVVKDETLTALTYTPSREQLRLTAHRISDDIYQKLTGEKGIFSTRIAYVLKRGTRYSLQVADADGVNAQEAFGSNEPIISPAWSPDGTRLAYVSFESRKPVIYVHEISTGTRRVVANFRGSNSAPSWSPDGKTLAVALSLSGIQQIYLVNADASGTPRRLTHSNAIDTEPVFSPDGQFLYFVSDRGGGPQIYRMPAAGGPAQRISFHGDYNVSVRVSPEGKQLAYITRRDGRYRTVVFDLASGEETLVTQTSHDESPSFAPNGRYLLYTTAEDGRDTLAIVSTDGRVRTRLSVATGDVREPTWGPFFK